MRFVFLISLFLVYSCAQAPVRTPASADVTFYHAEVDHQLSRVQVFPPDVSEGNLNFNIYLELKDAKGDWVDCKQNEVSLRKSNGLEVPFSFKRILRGRYYLTISNADQVAKSKFDLLIREEALAKNIKLFTGKPDRNYSRIEELNPEYYGFKLRMFIGDAQGRPLNLPTLPEVLITGQAEVAEMTPVAPGVWDFFLHYANYNQIIYLSVRANGVILGDLFRYQHIEK
jgi:hypothetical protein